ncbi:hypothetical protein OSTOST_15557, partial [Ostertagia ostertagi]
MIIQVLLPVVLARFAGAKPLLKIVVLIFGEHNFEDHVHSVKTAYLEIFESETTHLANYTVVAEYIDGGILRDKPSANRLQLTEEIVCEQVVNRSNRRRHLCSAATTSNTTGKIYPTFVRPTPAYADESYVFLKLLQRLDYRQVVVVSVKGDRNGEQFVELFEKKRKKYKVH